MTKRMISGEGKRKGLVILGISFLIGSLGLFLYAYHEGEKENLALRLRLQMLNETKKRPTPLVAQTPAPNTGMQEQESDPSDGPMAAPTSPPEQEQEEELALAARTSAQLGASLERAMARVQALSLEQLRQSLALSEEIIARHPLSYSAYKARLIILLVMEGKFGVELNQNDVDILLYELASYEPEEGDRLFLANALGDARERARQEGLERRWDYLAGQLELVEAELAASEDVATNRAEMLLARREFLSRQLRELEEQAASGEPMDLVEIPFQRSLAQGEYQAAIGEAQSLLESFPNSVVGHYYLIRALQLSGREREALEIVQGLNLPADKMEELSARLEMQVNPKDYWRYLSF